MEKVLNQQEIDAMVRRARGGDAGGKEEAKPAVVTVWDARQAGQIGREQVQSISTLHEGFARNLTHAVGAYLRVEFTAALVSAEHLTYGEVLQRVPEVSYLASCKLAPVGATALLQLDLAVAFDQLKHPQRAEEQKHDKSQRDDVAASAGLRLGIIGRILLGWHGSS